MNMNYYFIVMPLFLMLMYILGTRDYKVTKKGTRTFKPRFYKIFATIFTVTVWLMMFYESMHGIVQMFDDILRYDESDSAWSIILTVMAIGTVVVIYYSLCFMFANLGKKVRRNVE